MTRRASLPPAEDQAVQQTSDGVYHIASFELSRQLLRSDDVAQAGFMAETASQAGSLLGRPRCSMPRENTTTRCAALLLGISLPSTWPNTNRLSRSCRTS
ncbi:hypothetical protein [Deinococcus radiophilus]|uniref:hypothetical protein n=1 Tax=Deinococcus radiophilus TaxID=32062 RepID=UPI003608935B